MGLGTVLDVDMDVDECEVDLDDVEDIEVNDNVDAGLNVDSKTLSVDVDR